MKKRALSGRQTPQAPGRKTRPVEGGLRLPHERDESSTQPPSPPARVMKAAHDDVEAGLVDTDERGTKARRAFSRAGGDTNTGGSMTAPRRKRVSS